MTASDSGDHSRPSPLDIGGRKHPVPDGSGVRFQRVIREYPGTEEDMVSGAAVVQNTRRDGKSYKRLTMTVSATLVDALEKAAEADGVSVTKYLSKSLRWKVGL